jgi:tRNA-2-methylthio-N6-dimethylallyladenosine synthase
MRSRHPKTVYIETYGCQMNEADSELMSGIVKSAGFSLVDDMALADVILVNTCAVRDSAEQRAIGRLAELNKNKVQRPGVLLGVCGCMPKHVGENLMKEAPYVDLLVGPDSYRRLPDLIYAAMSERSQDLRLNRSETYAGLDRVRAGGSGAWITVMRGCDKFCTFCVVPYVRGRERSVPTDEIMAQAREAAAAGYREITLLGQTVNSYRWNGEDFADLLVNVSSVPGIERVRFTSPHPVDFTQKLVDTMAGVEQVCPHVHLPVQSGSDNVLKAMRREYTSAEYIDLVGRLRAAVPGISITTDILVGFPGETQEDYEATREMMERVRFDSAFTFRYSPREGTYAFKKMSDDVPEEEKGRRLSEVIDLQERISREVNQALIGTDVEVLVEGRSKRRSGQLFGKTGSFKTAVFPDAGVEIGSLATVTVVDATSHTLLSRANSIKESV